ncbi:MAG: hypothetical protein M1538_01510 [Candidatus Marsarchaeota archaeon]|nr:hypothetical protein [Candidatus Marsarchaeota archaeon]
MPNRKVGSFFSRNSLVLNSLYRIIFGVVWLVDATLKFQPGFISGYYDIIISAAQSAPVWLSGWFSFWVSIISSDPVLWAYIIMFSELAVALSLIFGFMRKISYSGGFILSLLIWSIPEGFGGPYGPNTTDIGTGIIYAIVFLMLIMINAIEGSSKYSLDYYIEKRVKWWRKLSEFGAGS